MNIPLSPIRTALFCVFLALGSGCASQHNNSAHNHNGSNALWQTGTGQTEARQHPGGQSAASPPLSDATDIKNSQPVSQETGFHNERIPGMEPFGAYALDGPDLLVVGDLAGTPLQGSLQRKGMVGMGKLKLYSQNDRLICESVIKSRPTEKGRIRGLLDCNDGTVILFTLRNLGPDQGLGIGTSHEGDKNLTLFYHPSAEEAHRRFPQILEEFTALRQEKRS